MKAFDPDAFSALVIEDFNWRIKEISDLRQVITLAGDLYGSVARKAALALIYAHWEGYVVFVATTYLAYVAKRKRTFSALMPSLHAVNLSGHMQEWQRQKATIGLRLKMIETFRSMQDEQFRKVPNAAVNAGGNLNYDRFSDICKVLMIDAAGIVTDQDFLDAEIVGVRNKIAHGSHVVITDDRLVRATDFVLSIMRKFRTDVENCVVAGSFLSLRPRAGQ